MPERIGLIDVDGHHFPNLALMRISSYHKNMGDTVEWYDGFQKYGRVYMSKIFSDSYTEDEPEPVNAEEVIKGGTGYCIQTVNGVEVYDKSKDHQLPAAMEKAFPDYSLYPQHEFAVAMTSRGCPRHCGFCHVFDKEGGKSVKVADVDDFWRGQKSIEVLDPNITACRDKRELFEQYIKTNAELNFNQGLDIRLLTAEDAEQLKQMKVRKMHFAWDNPKEDLTENFRNWVKMYGKKIKDGTYGIVYVLVNYGDTLEEALYRVETLKGLNYQPYIMVYNKSEAPEWALRMQRWVNNKLIFHTCQTFDEYDTRNRGRKEELDGQIRL